MRDVGEVQRPDDDAKAAAAAQATPLGGIAAAGLASNDEGQQRFKWALGYDAYPIVSDYPGGLILMKV